MDRETIISVLGDYVEFQTPVGPSDNLPAKCPFHGGGQEKNASFYVYVGPTDNHKTTGSSFCHRCGKGWSLRSLLRDLRRGYAEIHNTLSKVGVLNACSSKLGSGLSALSKPLDLSNPLIPEWLLGAYDYCPKLLLEQGFHKCTLRDFDIGFDLLHGRVTFPLRDHLGRLVGVSGRTVVGHPIRYKIYKSEINQPNYNLHKQRLLWNLHDVKLRASQKPLTKPIVLCEGFKAVMWLQQHGYPNALCSLGTSFSDEQILLISYLTDTVTLFFDNDKAGVSAANKAIKRLSKYFLVWVASYPHAHREDSPDDLSAEEIDHAVIDSHSVTEWRARYVDVLRGIRRERYE